MKMKEKIIEKIKEVIPADYDLLDELIIDTIAEEIVKLIKSEIYTDTDYLTESMFKHFR
jgi:hypothetical protein